MGAFTENMAPAMMILYLMGRRIVMQIETMAMAGV